VFFLPYYSGENFEFFRDNIFLSKDDILGSKPDQRQVYSRQVLNEHSFGKLYVMPSGEVFPNLNGEPLGSVYNESIPRPGPQGGDHRQCLEPDPDEGTALFRMPVPLPLSAHRQL